jgi:hypothetical protein
MGRLGQQIGGEEAVVLVGGALVSSAGAVGGCGGRWRERARSLRWDCLDVASRLLILMCDDCDTAIGDKFIGGSELLAM